MASSQEISIRQLGNYTKNPLLVKVFHELEWVEDLGSGTRNILKYAPLYYPKYQIGISNGQQFVFAITYASSDDGNVGRNHEMSVETVKLPKRKISDSKPLSDSYMPIHISHRRKWQRS